MKRYFAVVIMMCLFALAGIAEAVAQEVQKANPATDFEYDLNEAGDGVIIKNYKGTSTEVVIPAEIEDFPVVEVGSWTFSETNIVSVVFPDSATINDGYYEEKYGGDGHGCCSSCNSLVKVILPKKLKKIPDVMFYGCTSLKEIILPTEIQEIGYRAFSDSGLESIVIPDSIEEIKYNTFSGCIQLQTVVIGSRVKTIDTEAFYKCKALKTITLPDSIKTIGSEAFCESVLESIEIPDSVETIDARAFADCKELKTVSIGAGIREIKDKAFKNCSSLKNITIKAEKVDYGYYNDKIFSGCSSLNLKEKKKLKDTGYTGGF